MLTWLHSGIFACAQGVFVTTEPFYKSQPWGASQPMMLALHSDDENGAHMGSTPSVPTMADFQQHTVKIRYTRGFTTEKQGSGKITTTDIVSADGDGRRLQGNYLTKFKSELRTGFEFGCALACDAMRMCLCVCRTMMHSFC